ncbi:MAG: hypothetical protein QME55_00470 [Brevundimonas sp.]|uniref:hypothetical protein n=1 Tax=Brevundimonas sp. TaxID=1871086 RepID=UPI0026379AAC|nr:hypothetical protein [Brevundimonas sp.]MDI6623176.1 hypothetical protein [Brevundimonas sp.]MDQ7811207.1 hypothetical protein [Brevundimonas sp.]
MRRRLANVPLAVAEDPVELWAYVETGEAVATRRRGGRVSSLPDGRHIFTEPDRRGRRGVSAEVEIRPFRRIIYLVAQGERVVCFRRDLPA